MVCSRRQQYNVVIVTRAVQNMACLRHRRAVHHIWWVRPCYTPYPVRVRVENPPANIFRVDETAVATVDGH